MESSLEERIKNIIIETLGLFPENYELIDIEMKYPFKRLRIFIDKPGGVSIDDCAKVSKEISTRLDVEDIIRRRYILEVSSPGGKRRKTYDK